MRLAVGRERPWLASVVVSLVLGAATGCADGASGPGAPSPGDAASARPVGSAPWPDGLAAYVDQSRLERQGREVFVRLVDSTDHELTALRAEVGSERFATTTWTGEKTFLNEADLPVALPLARCGTGSDATVRLTYRVDGGPPVESTTTAEDRYGAVGLFLDRDCAAQRLADAADLEVGEPRVVGRGRGSVLELDVTLRPTGAAHPATVFRGFEDTVLFRQAEGSASVGSGVRVRLATGPPEQVRLRLVPSRCDPHALAEDKVGTLVGVRVGGPGLPAAASFYLPLPDATRAALRGFFATHCGL